MLSLIDLDDSFFQTRPKCPPGEEPAASRGAPERQRSQSQKNEDEMGTCGIGTFEWHRDLNKVNDPPALNDREREHSQRRRIDF